MLVVSIHSLPELAIQLCVSIFEVLVHAVHSFILRRIFRCTLRVKLVAFFLQSIEMVLRALSQVVGAAVLPCTIRVNFLVQVSEPACKMLVLALGTFVLHRVDLRELLVHRGTLLGQLVLEVLHTTCEFISTAVLLPIFVLQFLSKAPVQITEVIEVLVDQLRLCKQLLRALVIQLFTHRGKVCVVILNCPAQLIHALRLRDVKSGEFLVDVGTGFDEVLLLSLDLLTLCMSQLRELRIGAGTQTVEMLMATTNLCRQFIGTGLRICCGRSKIASQRIRHCREMAVMVCYRFGYCVHPIATLFVHCAADRSKVFVLPLQLYFLIAQRISKCLCGITNTSLKRVA